MTSHKDNVTGKHPFTGKSKAKDGTAPIQTVKGANSSGKDNARSTQRNV